MDDVSYVLEEDIITKLNINISWSMIGQRVSIHHLPYVD